MTESFTDYLEQVPDTRRAVADEAGALSYGELIGAARSAATCVREAVGAGGYVVVPARTSVDFLVTVLGILYSGNTPVPVDPKTPAQALQYILDKCGAPKVFLPLQRDEYAAAPPLHAPDASRPGMIMFTSGTTGPAKGVIMSHANLIHSCAAVSEYLRFREHDSTLVVLPLFYSYGLISQVLCQLFVGGYVRLGPDLRNPLAFAKVVEQEAIASFCGVPSSFLALTKMHRLRPMRLPSVKVICSAGAAFDYSLYGSIKEVFPNATLFNNYGMTEACPRISFIPDTDPAFFDQTCGRPMRGVEVKLVDPDTLEGVPAGEQGVLVVKGPNVTEGYLHDEARTRRAFTADGYLISGDIAQIRDGLIYLHGRRDDIFNVAGEKVSPLEIEGALNSLPEVECSAVRGFPDPVRGSAPVAFLLLRAEVRRRDLDRAMASRLTPNKIPATYYAASSLPMTSNGKIQRRLLDPTAPAIIREIK